MPDRRLLSFEPLEDRRVLAAFTVTTGQDLVLNDDNELVPAAGSLRAAVIAANNNDEGDTITFAPNVGLISLNGGEIEITGQMENDASLQILGPSPALLTIRGGGAERIFKIQDDGILTVIIGGMTLTNGRAFGADDAGLGGAIFNTENLTMVEVVLEGNNASRGGGAIFHDIGDLRISRSLIQGNTAGAVGGGGVMSGKVADTEGSETPPNSTIIDSTFKDNSATGGDAVGGGLYNANGTMTIRQSTIVGNSASMGGGVASQGNPIPEGADDEMPPDPLPDPPPPNVFTFIGSSIIWMNDESDVDRVGMSTGENPIDLLPSIFAPPEMPGDDPAPGTLGYNFVGTGNATTAGPDFAFMSTGDMVGVDPGFISDDMGNPIFANYGGVTPVFMLSETSPAIDQVPQDEVGSSFEQRGRHFTRVFNYGDPTDEMGARMDVGAVERQIGTFSVDILADESDSQYSDVGFGNDPYTSGDFSLREALLFSELNPEIDTVQFSDSLRAPGATITVTLGAMSIVESVNIIGPDTWLLTINGFDATPLVKNSDGMRIFEIDNGDDDMANDFLISNLIVSGADFAGSGGAIFNRENLTLSGMTFRNNGASLRGGAIFSEYGNLTIDGTTINDNRAGDDGGGIYVQDLRPDAEEGDPPVVRPVMLITSSTISGNLAGDRGAGITNNNTRSVTIKYSTITNNSSGSTQASGIANFGADAKTALYSSIVSGNANFDIGAFLSATATSFQTLGWNIVGRGSPGSVAVFTGDGDKPGILDPMLDPLAITGGRVATHRPKPGSPAIDMGNPADVPDGMNDVPEFDQRGEGFPRVYDDGVNPARIDIGAYELQPTLLIVDSSGSDDDGDYTVDNLTLVEAIKIANLNPLPDTITFNIGNLFGGISAGETVLTITDHLTITGPGSGILAILPGGSGSIFRVDNSNATVLDVSITGLELRDASAGAVLSRENLTLDDILFVNNSSTTSGGALFHETGSLSIANTLITGNFTNGLNADGGGVFVRNSDNVQLDNVTVAGNRISQTGSDGAGLAFVNSTVTTNFLTVAGNNAPASNSRGGGIFLQDSTLSLLDGVVSSNSTAGSNSVGGGIAAFNSRVFVGPNSLINVNGTLGSQAPGGGMYISGRLDPNEPSLEVIGAQISQNFTMGHTASGGAIHLTNGADVYIERTVISQNFVNGNGSHGGAIANSNSALVLRDSLINGNEARHSTGKGGGIYSDTNLSNQSTLILNSTLSGNSASLRGGGLFNADGRTDIKHSTITNNSSVSTLNAGAGVASFGNPSTTLTTVYSSIIAGNVGVEEGTHTDVDSVEAGFINTFQSLGYNIVGTGNSQAAFDDDDPTDVKIGDHDGVVEELRLGPLADNTDDPFTAIPLRTHAPLEGSLAINGGDPAFSPNAYAPSLALDQRGKDRVQHLRIDIGAHESDLAPGVPGDFDSDSDVDGRDFLTWQRNLGNDIATRADGDADGNGVVNGQDLGVWQDNFGSAGGSSIVASAAGSSAALNAGLSTLTNSSESLSAAATVSEVWAVGSSGTPAEIAASTEASEARLVEEQATESQEASLPNSLWSSAGHSLLEQEYDFKSLAREEAANGAAEDAVFAEWGAELL